VWGCFIKNDIDSFHGGNGGYGMLVYQLLFTLAVENDGEVVKALYQSPKLETICQVNGNGNMLFPDLIQENILQINITFHNLEPPRQNKIKKEKVKNSLSYLLYII